MTIINTWSIERLDCYPELDGLLNVVIIIHWRLDATDGTYNGMLSGTVGMTPDPMSPYTPYNELTEEQVMNWTWTALGSEQVQAYENTVAAQIESQIAPNIIIPPLPWNT